MEFSRQEYWSELPFPSPGDLLVSGIKPMSPALQADYLPLGKCYVLADVPVNLYLEVPNFQQDAIWR